MEVYTKCQYILLKSKTEQKKQNLYTLLDDIKNVYNTQNTYIKKKYRYNFPFHMKIEREKKILFEFHFNNGVARSVLLSFNFMEI